MMALSHHIFVCTNERKDEPCCAAQGAFDILKAIKHELRARGLDHADGIMANKSGCFAKCGKGPNVVIYPSGTWLQVSSTEEAVSLIDRLQLESNS